MNQDEIIVEFKEKKQNYKIVIGFIIVAILVLSIGASLKNIDLAFIFIGVALIALIANIFSFSYWTCPNCKKYLGGSLDIQNCKNCGVSFNISKESVTKIMNNSEQVEKASNQSYSSKNHQAQNREDKEISSSLIKIQLSILIISLITLLTYKFGYKNNIIMNLGLGLISIVFLIEFTNSFFSNEIYLGAISIKYKSSPRLFRVFQFIAIFLAVLCFIVLLKNL